MPENKVIEIHVHVEPDEPDPNTASILDIVKELQERGLTMTDAINVLKDALTGIQGDIGTLTSTIASQVDTTAAAVAKAEELQALLDAVPSNDEAVAAAVAPVQAALDELKAQVAEAAAQATALDDMTPAAPETP